MRFRVPTAVAVGVATIGLGAAGCQSSPSSASGQGVSVPAQSASVSATGPAATAPAATLSAGNGGGNGASGKGGAAKCETSQLRASLGTKGTYQGTNNLQVVDLANVSSASCTLYGFPGVDLVGTVGGKKGYRWSLDRGTTVLPARVTLAPGGVAHFNIVYLAWGNGTAGRKLNVDEIVVTPPDDRAHKTVTWNQGILLQDAATHSGTWIQPLQPGA